MKAKSKRELLEDIRFQQMKRYLGIQRVRNYCTGCGEEFHEPVYCAECAEEVERVQFRNKFK